MRKFSLLLSAFIVFTYIFMSSLAAAENGKISIEPWIGYTSFKMNDVNDKMKTYITNNANTADLTIINYLINFKTTIDPTLSYTTSGQSSQQNEAKNGNTFGLDMNYKINSNISIGPRISYTTVSDASYETKNQFNVTYFGGQWVDSYDYKIQMKDISLLPVMIGGKYSKNIKNKLSVNGALYVGYGFAKGTMETNLYAAKDIGSSSLKKASSDIAGSNFLSEISAGCEYELTKSFSLGLNIGYRLAKFKMKFDSDRYEYSYANGSASGSQKLANKNDDANMDFDFSGMTSSFALNYKF